VFPHVVPIHTSQGACTVIYLSSMHVTRIGFGDKCTVARGPSRYWDVVAVIIAVVLGLCFCLHCASPALSLSLSDAAP
jgi:hypothetical protein